MQRSAITNTTVSANDLNGNINGVAVQACTGGFSILSNRVRGNSSSQINLGAAPSNSAL
jgi:hypothetical protein